MSPVNRVLGCNALPRRACCFLRMQFSLELRSASSPDSSRRMDSNRDKQLQSRLEGSNMSHSFQKFINSSRRINPLVANHNSSLVSASFNSQLGRGPSEGAHTRSWRDQDSISESIIGALSKQLMTFLAEMCPQEFD